MTDEVIYKEKLQYNYLNFTTENHWIVITNPV